MKEQDPLFSISIEEILKEKIIEQGNNNILVIKQVPKYIGHLSFPLRINAFALFVCLKGEIDIIINLKNWNVKKNNYVISLPENIIGINSISKNFDGYAVLVSNEYLSNINVNLKEILPYYIRIRNHPCFSMQPEVIEETIHFCNLLSLTLESKYIRNKAVVVKGLIAASLSKLAGDLELSFTNISDLKFRSKEDYFLKFTELLLQNYRKEHNISFYAEKLFLSPKYFSSVIKDVSGISVSKWINDYIVVEAKALLKTSDMNIKQIAEYLNFANPSFFSKYFKQHTKLTPKEYRNMIE